MTRILVRSGEHFFLSNEIIIKRTSLWGVSGITFESLWGIFRCLLNPNVYFSCNFRQIVHPWERCGSELGAGAGNCDEAAEVDGELEDEEVYSVIMTEYLAGGGDGFKVISEHKERQLQGPLDTDILKAGGNIFSDNRLIKQLYI